MAGMLDRPGQGRKAAPPEEIVTSFDLITAKDLAKRLGWPGIKFRTKLRARGFRWHLKHERWSFPFGSDQARDMIRVFRECGGRVDTEGQPVGNADRH